MRRRLGLAMRMAAAAFALALGGCEVRADPPPLSVTQGGAGGRAIRVTTLADDGPGSLRAAIAQSGARTVSFDVAGEIWLKSALIVREPYLTIAGESAPSPGISLMGDGLKVRGHDVIVRHLRVRIGEQAGGTPPSNRDGIGVDGSLSGEKPAYNIQIENCSVAWSIDEGLTIYGPNTHDIVIRDSIVAEGLRRSIHPKGAHSMGLLVGPRTRDILVQGNILASNRLRNPVVSAGASAIIVNNLIHNPGGAGLHFYARRNDDPIRVAAVGNLLIAGADTKPALRAFAQGLAPGSAIHYRDNVAEGTSAFATDEIMPDGTPAPFVDQPPLWRPGLTPLPADAVRASAIKRAGARPWDRDATDKRIIAEIEGGGGRIVDQPVDLRLRASVTGEAGEAMDCTVYDDDC